MPRNSREKHSKNKDLVLEVLKSAGKQIHIKEICKQSRLKPIQVWYILKKLEALNLAIPVKTNKHRVEWKFNQPEPIPAPELKLAESQSNDTSNATTTTGEVISNEGESPGKQNLS